MPAARPQPLRRHLILTSAAALALLGLTAFLGLKVRSRHQGLERLEGALYLGALAGSAALVVHGARVRDRMRQPEGLGEDGDC